MDEKYPLLTDRIQSTFIDTLLIVLCMFIFSFILDKMQDPPDWLRMVLFLGIWVLYEPLCTTLGCTLGNFIKHIRVRRETDTSKRLNFLESLIRYIVKVLFGWISFLTINTNPKRMAIHDFAVGSVMIKID